ncbi:MAG: glutamate--tRNA ligase, partial [Nitrospinota bacterium]
MTEEKVRVRFAPSPTGYLHIGSVRTALFNWLFARRMGGTYILRIEDTDRERSTEEFIEQILECHAWLGIDIDEPPSDKPPYRQTDRMELYRGRALELIEKGAAYRCICTPDEVEEMRRRALAEGRPPRYDGRCRERGIGEDVGKPFAIRFKTPGEGVTVVDDLLRGPVRFENKQIDDFVLIRSNGIPTYNFAAPVDDIDLRVTHVLRGDDHLSNTPKQQMVFNALGAPLPRFGHFSMILGPD